ncbi:Gp37 family protein [Ignavibacterium sp.]|uniref:Gp37 family protein n=1 Tax=Ignavibacterium sp. TaxID=2651167 RepID=UPI00307E0198
MIKEAKDLFVFLIDEAQRNYLTAEQRLNIEIPLSLDNYKLTHPIGSYLVIYRGSLFAQTDVRNIIAQTRDLEIMVVVVARAGFVKTPEEYLDFIINEISGVEIADLKRTDRRIYCKEDEFIGEENGVWSYAATFVVPNEFIKA